MLESVWQKNVNIGQNWTTALQETDDDSSFMPLSSPASCSAAALLQHVSSKGMTVYIFSGHERRTYSGNFYRATQLC